MSMSGSVSFSANLAYAQKDLHVDGGTAYRLQVHVKELGPDNQYGAIYVFRTQEIQSNGFRVFGSQYAQLGQLTFNDTGTYTLPLSDQPSEDLTVLIGYASASPSYMVIDDISLSTCTAQDYLTQTFDTDIAPWRNHVLEPDTPRRCWSS